MNPSDKKRGSILTRWPFWFAIFGILILGGAATAGIRGFFGGKKSETNDPSFVAQEGPLTISVSQSGTIKASETEIIKNQVEGNTTILYLIPEGTSVKKGDLLVELDSSSIQDQLTDQIIRVQNAEAAFISAREGLEVAKNQAKADVDKAELQYKFAQQDLQKYKEGEYPKALKECESKITIATEELRRAEEKAKWSKILYSEKYLSQTELQADELSANKTKLSLELAQNDLKLLKEFTNVRQIAQLDSDVSQSQMALDRTKRKAAADISEAEANFKAKESEYNRQKDKQAKLELQIKNAKIYATADGLVVYATSVSGGDFHGDRDQPLAEGQSVRERQELIHLPKTSSFIAQIKIPETSLDKIKLGLPVRLVVDAIPGKVYTGRMTKIAPLPDATSVFMNPDLKVYNSEITINEKDKLLRTGMSCRAEIIAAQYDKAVFVPVQAVTRLGKVPTLYVESATGWAPRTVKIGYDNNKMVHIISGLKPGEKVQMNPPLAPSAADQPSDAEQKENKTLLTNAAKQKDAPSSSTLAGRGGNMSPEQRQQAMEAMKAAGVPMTADGRPDFANMSDEQRQALRTRFAGGRGGGAAGGAPGEAGASADPSADRRGSGGGGGGRRSRSLDSGNSGGGEVPAGGNGAAQ